MMFDDYFDVYLADNDESKQIHYNIRYQVYCEEMGFEKTSNGAQLEMDEWDKYSVHLIVKNKLTGHFVGAMRLILPELGYLPLEKHCRLSNGVIKSDLHRSVEISRLCVIKEIRRRSSDGEPPTGLTEKHGANDDVDYLCNQRRLSRSVIWGMFRAASLYCAENRIHNWYFLTTKMLYRLITKENFKMDQIGDSCELNGQRFPYRIHMNEILQNPIWNQGFQSHYKYYSAKDNDVLKQCA
ncbi:PEP-CTERM/exosortase system-associated acyltransferase [Methylotuvimicrobium sp. KM1]|uniref:PEP-CTERM/exosortase system-associated acyltransferase n=1 Tax=Methylotuvimicrobium sp. KM1 TaxID=3377707 RepID=UPI00384C1C5D